MVRDFWVADAFTSVRDFWVAEKVAEAPSRQGATRSTLSGVLRPPLMNLLCQPCCPDALRPAGWSKTPQHGR